MSYPILEHDPSPQSHLEPTHFYKPLDIPERCVLCFFQDTLTHVIDSMQPKVVRSLRSEIGPNPIYEIATNGQRIAILHPGVGAPLAGGFLEELIALGCKKFIACGGAGVLDSGIAVGEVIVPTAAVRDEGTSYHYLPPAREVQASPQGIAAIERALQTRSVPYRTGKTWTTDALYRETPAKIAKRRAEGCLTVEMEAAAFFAIAQFRGVTFAQMLYGGDDLGSDQWDSRGWDNRSSVRDKLFWLAVEACLQLE